jgi:hypothetical protein
MSKNGHSRSGSRDGNVPVGPVFPRGTDTFAAEVEIPFGEAEKVA